MIKKDKIKGYLILFLMLFIGNVLLGFLNDILIKDWKIHGILLFIYCYLAFTFYFRHIQVQAVPEQKESGEK